MTHLIDRHHAVTRWVNDADTDQLREFHTADHNASYADHDHED